MHVFPVKALVAVWIALGLGTAATALETPKGEPILVISGAIERTNVDSEARFDRTMLEALGLVAITTSTPWYDGKTTFEGVPMERLMEAVGSTGREVTAIALNDYVIQIPVEDFVTFKPILALKRDGRYMSVREQGPLFVVYPYDSDPKLRTQTYYSRSAWQVVRLVVH